MYIECQKCIVFKLGAFKYKNDPLYFQESINLSFFSTAPNYEKNWIAKNTKWPQCAMTVHSMKFTTVK